MLRTASSSGAAAAANNGCVRGSHACATPVPRRHPTSRLHPNSPWPERDAELIRLVEAGNNRHAVAQEMKLPLNQVIGRIHRLRVDGTLPPSAAPVSPGKRRGATPVPAAASPAPLVIASSAGVQLPAVDAGRAEDWPPPPAVMAPRKPAGRVEPCCWPIGTPSTRSFRYCEATSEPGKVYCTPHCDLAWPDRKRAAAA